MADYSISDLSITEEGDLRLLAGDLGLSGDRESDYPTIKQQVLARLKTTIGDIQNAPSVGASLDDFIGYPENEETLEEIKERIRECLTFDDFVDTNDLEIEAEFISAGVVSILITISLGEQEAIEIPYTYSFYQT